MYTEDRTSMQTLVLNTLDHHAHQGQAKVRADVRFIDQGIEPSAAKRIVIDLSTKLGRPLPSDLLVQFPTVQALVRHLSAPTPASSPGEEPRPAGAPPVDVGDSRVAIVGIGCRFAGGVHGPSSFWEFLRRAGDGVIDVPADRWSLDRFYDDQDGPGKMVVRRGAFLQDDVFAFEPDFFGMTPREARTLDPQQRLLLETAFEAFDDAGQSQARLRGSSTGVFMGGFMMDNLVLKSGRDALDAVDSHSAVAGSATLIANRVSHAFDLMGPSMSVDTACSSSMVAVHLGCRSVLDGECSQAIVGGVNVMLSPTASILMSKGRFLAKDGRSKAFFDAADGYGRGEGAGAIVIKRLRDAIRDQDRIYAVIDGTAVNQDG